MRKLTLLFSIHTNLNFTPVENKNDQRKQIEEKLIAKATKDESFRKNLLTSPRETLETELGIIIPKAVNIKVLEEDQNSFYLILPPIVNPETEDELSEAELEMVSGGYDGGSPEHTIVASCPLSSCIN